MPTSRPQERAQGGSRSDGSWSHQPPCAARRRPGWKRPHRHRENSRRTAPGDRCPGRRDGAMGQESDPVPAWALAKLWLVGVPRWYAEQPGPYHGIPPRRLDPGAVRARHGRSRRRRRGRPSMVAPTLTEADAPALHQRERDEGRRGPPHPRRSGHHAAPILVGRWVGRRRPHWCPTPPPRRPRPRPRGFRGCPDRRFTGHGGLGYLFCPGAGPRLGTDSPVLRFRRPPGPAGRPGRCRPGPGWHRSWAPGGRRAPAW